jgi:hypothetical protein
MSYDDTLATEAINLADGADIHAVTGIVSIYRSVTREKYDAMELERELRSYVARKRQQRFQLRRLSGLDAPLADLPRFIGARPR